MKKLFTILVLIHLLILKPSVAGTLDCLKLYSLKTEEMLEQINSIDAFSVQITKAFPVEKWEDITDTVKNSTTEQLVELLKGKVIGFHSMKYPVYNYYTAGFIVKRLSDNYVIISRSLENDYGTPTSLSSSDIKKVFVLK